jgi:hypothetical protein
LSIDEYSYPLQTWDLPPFFLLLSVCPQNWDYDTGPGYSETFKNCSTGKLIEKSFIENTNLDFD